MRIVFFLYSSYCNFHGSLDRCLSNAETSSTGHLEKKHILKLKNTINLQLPIFHTGPLPIFFSLLLSLIDRN